MANRGTAPSLHEQAANGDWRAFSHLAQAHYQRALSGLEPGIVALARAAVYARLAAMRGGRDEMVTFIYLLEEHSHALRDTGLTMLADEAQGEAVALAEYMADDGDEEMGAMVARAAFADELSPEVLLVARDLRKVEIH